MKIRFLGDKTLFLFVNLLYNSFQSVANQGLANNLFQPLTVIYLDVRSLNVGDLIEKNTIMSKPYFLISTLSFNLKVFDFFKYSFTQPRAKGEFEIPLSPIVS